MNAANAPRAIFIFLLSVCRLSRCDLEMVVFVGMLEDVVMVVDVDVPAALTG